jgi:predicted secreted protein
MKNYFACLRICIITVVFFTWQTMAENIEITVDKTFTIELPENPTTGYSWFWSVNEDVHKRLVELIRKEYIPQQPAMVGSGGTVKFTFKAIHAGSGPVMLTLKRIWHMNSDQDQKRFDIIVHAKKHKKAKKA